MSLLYALVNDATAASTSALVVILPTDSRTVDRAASADTPELSRTLGGVMLPVWQAEVVEASRWGAQAARRRRRNKKVLQ